MKKKKKTSKIAIPSVLDSENWISQSSVSGSIVRAQAQPPRDSPSGGPCKIIITTNPKATCCATADCPKTIHAKVEANDPECRVLLTLPDGTQVGGMGNVSADYNVKETDSGKILLFKGSGEGTAGDCGDVEKKVPVFEAVFEVLEWSPRIMNESAFSIKEELRKIPDSLFQIGVNNYIEIPNIVGADDLFETKARVKVDVKPDAAQLGNDWEIFKPFADSCCKEWTLEIVQGIFEPAEIRQTRRNRWVAEVVWNPPLPVRDRAPNLARPIPFKGVGDAEEREMWDTPNEGMRLDWIEGIAVPIAVVLETLKKYVLFYDWVVVKNEKCKMFQTLAWVRWSIDFWVKVDITGVPPDSVKPEWLRKIALLEAQGLGAGPKEVVWAPQTNKDNPKLVASQIP